MDFSETSRGPTTDVQFTHGFSIPVSGHFQPISCCGRFEKRPYRPSQLPRVLISPIRLISLISPIPPTKNLHIPIILINFAIPDCTNQPPMLVMGGFVRRFPRAIWDVVTNGRDRASGHRNT